MLPGKFHISLGDFAYVAITFIWRSSRSLISTSRPRSGFDGSGNLATDSHSCLLSKVLHIVITVLGF